MNSVYKGCHSERPEGFSEGQGEAVAGARPTSLPSLPQTQRPLIEVK